MSLFASKKITDLEASNASLTGQLAQTNAEKGQLQERLTALEAVAQDGPALEAVRAENVTLTADLASVRENLTTATGKIGAFEAAIADGGLFAFADGKLSLTAEGKTKLVNAEATNVLAATGHKPLAIGGTVDTGTGATAKLTGRDRLRAETRAEFDSKKPAAV